MCVVTHYRDFHCKHRWATITTPCYLGMGFDNCPMFYDGQVRPPPRMLVAQGEMCPRWYVLLFFFYLFYCDERLRADSQ